MRGYPVFGGDPDHDLLDRGDILADVLAIRLQVTIGYPTICPGPW